MQKQIKNILVFRNDRFGEFLLNIPAFCALKKTFPDARLTAVVDSYVKELAERAPCIDEVVEWRQGKHSLPDNLRFTGFLKKHKFDMAIMLNPSRGFNMVTFLAGISVRVGYDRKWGFLLTHKMEDRKYLAEKHEVEYNLDLAKLAGAGTQDAGLSLRIDDNFVKKTLEEFNIKEGVDLAALHPWTSDVVKQWPPGNFLRLARELIGDKKLKLVIIGGKDEADKSTELFRPLSSALINLTGRASLLQTAALLKKCKLLISGDSGPVHLASCVGTPVIALFRNDILGKGPIRWGPRGPGNVVLERPRLTDIAVEEVLKEAGKIFEGKN